MSKRVPKTMIFVEFSTSSDANVYKDRAKTCAKKRDFVDFQRFLNQTYIRIAENRVPKTMIFVDFFMPNNTNVYTYRVETRAKKHDFRRVFNDF